jgi:hypothetical protein
LHWRIAVSAFAVLGDLFRPKSFAGLFGAAPSVALATLTIAFWNQGPAYAALEGRSMMIGSLALCLYSVAVFRLTKRYQLPASVATGAALIVWLYARSSENGSFWGNAMTLGIKLSVLRDTRWHEYVIWFVLGGLATACTGAIATLFGPETRGLFLAFPAIFCASATLVAKHERERKERAGVRGTDVAKRLRHLMPQARPWEAWGFLPSALRFGC